MNATVNGVRHSHFALAAILVSRRVIRHSEEDVREERSILQQVLRHGKCDVHLVVLHARAEVKILTLVDQRLGGDVALILFFRCVYVKGLP